jgi:hypothetical protein
MGTPSVVTCRKGEVMDVIYSHCCGLDVHKRNVVACLIVPGPGGKPTKTVRTFGTMTEDILALADWLTEAGCTHVALESTGVFWKPIYNLLESSFELLLVNARHIKATTGDYSQRQHGCFAGSHRGDGSDPSPVRPALPAA